MSDAPVRVQANITKHRKPASTKRAGRDKTNEALRAEFDAMMERSSKKLAKLNSDMDELLARLGDTHLTS